MTGIWGLQEGCTVHRSLWNSIPALEAEHSWSTCEPASCPAQCKVLQRSRLGKHECAEQAGSRNSFEDLLFECLLSLSASSHSVEQHLQGPCPIRQPVVLTAGKRQCSMGAAAPHILQSLPASSPCPADAGQQAGGNALTEALQREALLAKLTEQLRGRLAAVKEENAQLEDLLHQADARASGRAHCWT